MKPQKTSTVDGVTSTGTPDAQPSDLDNLDALAAQVDADATGTLPDGTLIADQPAPVNYGQEAAATVDTFAALLVGYCPAAAELWTEDKKQAVAMALAPVLEKYGITLGALPCELVLIITAGPLLYQSAKLVAAQMQAERAKVAAQRSAKAQDKPAAQAAAEESPEVLRHPQTALYPK